MKILRQRNNRALIYLYRDDELKSRLGQTVIKDFLSRFNYHYDTIDQALTMLIKRITTSSQFPHEIGIFLGYPLADVVGFIDNNGSNYQSIGYWKVYSDNELCQSLFTAYRECTKKYLSLHSHGLSLRDLVHS